MKIMHLLQSGNFSGAENVVCQIISMFKNEYNVDMVYCSKDGQIREALKERNIRFLPMRKLCISEVRRVVKEYKPDIIHAHDMKASFIASLACRRTVLISHIHNNSFDSRRISVKALAYLIAAINSKHIFWVSESAYQGYYFHKLFWKKSSILYNIIDIDLLYSKMKQDNNEYEYDIVFLGRLTYPKNPQRLLRILRLAVNIDNQLRIAIIGSGDLEEEIHELCKKIKLDNNVDFLGFCSNPLKILYDSKAMIMTSRWEGTPMCALEAMALGVPIISTPTDGLNVLISNGVNGFLSDNDEELANNLVKIVISKDDRNAMKNAQLTKAYSINNINRYKEKIMKVYLR